MHGGLAALPYFRLAGPGFERLIYELLQAGNQRPWFFGRTGQAQYGIDIVTEVAGHQDVYQCKNYADVPSWPKVRDAVAKFESLSFWDRHAIDSHLKRLPDLVAGLFSGLYAEHFCGRDNWRDDPWVRLQRGHARFLSINRFLERHDRNTIYVAERHERLFLEALDRGSAVALRGLPGMGKTFLALELACRLRQPLRRIYYATLKDGSTAERLWQSATRRQSLPSLFVLDDCHLAPQAAESFLERLHPELASGELKLVLLLRDQVGAAPDKSDDTPEWFSRLEHDRAIIDLHADVARTLAVACHLRPDFTGLSRSRTQRLHNICGGDLLLLDEILQTITVPRDIESLDVNKVLTNVRTNYFGGNVSLPTLATLAALAQFDLSPLADFFSGKWRPNEEKSADPLMTRLYAPPRYQFLHSSLAALVLRALAQLEVQEDALDDMVGSTTATAWYNYFTFLDTFPENASEFVLSIQQFLKGRQLFEDELTEARVRAAVLGHKAIESAIESHLAKFSFTNLGLCVRWLSAAEHPAKVSYVELIEQRFRILFGRENPGDDTAGMNTLGTGLLVLRRCALDRWQAVLNRHGSDAFLRLILANGSLSELFKILANSTPQFRAALLEQLTSTQAEALLDKTIAAGRSIGTLNLAMRELGETNPDLLVRLEHAIGAPAFLRLLLSNATLSDLFKILQYATPQFRAALLGQLTSTQAEALLDKTIAAGRSIGTLHLAMRELGETDPDLLVHLERAIGATAFLRLILSNGTLSELFKILQYATSGFRAALLEQLTSTQAEALLDKTIAAGRSIGTLSLAVRELGETDPDLLAALERAIGAPAFLRLILSNGTLPELFKVLETSTPQFRTVLLEQLTSTQAEALLDKTIAAGRSIGTLSFAMRELGETNSDLLAALERAIGAPAFLRLILSNGTLFELFKVLQYATPPFRTALLEQLTFTQAEALLDKTIAEVRRIETLHFTLRRLSNNSVQLATLEKLLGVEGWWRLLIACGSLNAITQITQAMSSPFRAQVIAAATNLSIPNWRAIIARGLFLNACEFTTNELPLYSSDTQNNFRAALREAAPSLAARACWFDLNPSRPAVDPEHPESVILAAALRSRMEALQLTELFELDFREAVNALSCCWRERPDLRSELGQNLRKILPAPETWPRKNGEFAAIRLVLALARNVEFQEGDALWVLAEVTGCLDSEICGEIHTFPLFLLVWNMAALCYERGPKQKFAETLPLTAQELLLEILSHRIKPKESNQEKLAHFTLAGLLAFLFPHHKRRLVNLLAPLKGAVRWLTPLAMDQSFVPAVFALEGVALLTGREEIFTSAVCEKLLPKFEEYEDVGLALENLRLRISGDKHPIRRP